MSRITFAFQRLYWRTVWRLRSDASRQTQQRMLLDALADDARQCGCGRTSCEAVR